MTQNVLWRLEEKLFAAPPLRSVRLVVLMIGTNNARDDPEAHIVAGIDREKKEENRREKRREERIERRGTSQRREERGTVSSERRRRREKRKTKTRD